jgi:TrmH family RNA methyltransferase
MALERLSSLQNPKLKLAQSLQDKKARLREGLFVVDYARDLQRALLQGYGLAYALYCPTLATPEERDLLESLDNVYEVSPEAMAKAAYRQNPTGLLVVLHSKPAPALAGLRQDPADYLLVLVGLEKPGNIGALLRSADATGFSAILLVDTALDLFNPNIIRASTGAVFLDNVYAANTVEALSLLHDLAYQRVAGHLSGDVSLFQARFQARTALVLGTEDVGLDATWTQACQQLVKIPMQGVLTDSFNVSVSGALFMFEALRQRHLL